MQPFEYPQAFSFHHNALKLRGSMSARPETRKITKHVVSGFKDGVQWDEWAGPLRCTLKLVNLTAGAIEIQEVLRRVGSPGMPSWTTATGSPANGDRKTSTSLSSQASLCYCCSRWDQARPWREGTCRRELHWNRAGPAFPRDPPPIKPPLRESAPTPLKRQICVELPRAEQTQLSSPSGYSTKYFGLVEGALSILTKVENLEPRSNLSSRSQDSSELDALSISPLDERSRGPRKRRQRGSKALRPSARSLRSPYDRLPFSAHKALHTRPVEAPEPSPWSGSKFTISIQPFDQAGKATQGDLKDSQKIIFGSEIDLSHEHGDCCANSQEVVKSNRPSRHVDRGVRTEVLLIDSDVRGKEAERDCNSPCLVESPPQPGLYDVWIPRQSFHGKALMRPTAAGSIPSIAAGATNRRIRIPRTGPKPTGHGQYTSLAIPRAPLRDDIGNMGTLAEKEPAAVVSTSPIVPEESTVGNTGCTCGEVEVDFTRRTSPCFPGGTSKNFVTGWPVGNKRFDYATQFSWRTVATELCSPGYASVDEGEGVNHKGKDFSEGLSPEKQAAAKRTRRRSEHAVRAAVGRLRAPQCIFNSLHRSPSRPEMRRSITRGRFSPLGRKLWRRSEGLSPRVGQVRLQATSPPSRIFSSALEDGEYTDLGLAPHGLSMDADRLWSTSIRDVEETGPPKRDGREESRASDAVKKGARQVRGESNNHNIEGVGVRITANGQGQGRDIVATPLVEPAVVAGTEIDARTRGGSTQNWQKRRMENSYAETGAEAVDQDARIGTIGGVLGAGAESGEETRSMTWRHDGEPIAVDQRPDMIARCEQYSVRFPWNGHNRPNIGRRGLSMIE